MAYDVNTITVKGAELLAAATAADKLILDGCDATTTYLDAATAALVESRPASPLSNTTDVSIIMYTSNNVQARASFVAGTNTGGDANTLYLYGHKQSAPNDIYVIYVASSQDPFHLPEVGDVANSYETLFNMQYTIASGAVTTPSTSTFCTLAEFNILKERTVTTHKEGETTVGDNQTIYGDKYFRGDVTCHASLGAGQLVVSDIDISGNIYVQEDELSEMPGDIGKSTRPFNNIYVDTTHTGTIANGGVEIEIGDAVYFDSTLRVNGDITPDIDANIVSVPNIGYDLGSSSKRFKCVYTESLSGGSSGGAHEIKVEKGMYFTSDCYIYPITASTCALGTYSNPFGNANIGGLRIIGDCVGKASYDGSVVVMESYAYFTYDGVTDSGLAILQAPYSNFVKIARESSGYGSFIVSLDGTSCLSIGYSSAKGDYVISVDEHAQMEIESLLTVGGGITGNQPKYTSGSDTRGLSVGSIVLALYESNSGSLKHTGDEFTQPGSMVGDYLLFAKTNGPSFGLTSTGSLLPQGKYVFLCDIPAGTDAYAVLVQCTSLS